MYLLPQTQYRAVTLAFALTVVQQKYRGTEYLY